jgi:hypothetical protein
MGVELTTKIKLCTSESWILKNRIFRRHVLSKRAYGVRRGVYGVLIWKPEGKKPLGRPRRRLEDDIKRDLQEVGWSGMDWIDLAQDRDRWRALVTAVMKFQVP